MLQRLTIFFWLVLGAVSAWAQPSYPDFSSITGLNLEGIAAQAGTVLRLTPSSAEVYGGAWYANKINISNGFTTRFQFQISDTQVATDGAGNGIAFVFQNDNATESVSPIGTYYEMGDANVQIGCSIEFRTSEKEGNYGTIPVNQVSVQTNGASAANDMGYPTYTVASQIVSPFKDGATHTVLINYVPGTLKIFLDDLSNPIINYSINFTNYNGGSILDGSGDAWVGIVAGTCGNDGANGPAYEQNDILNWSSLSVKVHNDTTCANEPVRLNSTVTGGALPLSYQWSPAAGLDSSNIAKPLATVSSQTTYTVTVTDANGTKASDVLTVYVHSRPTVKAGPGFTVCQEIAGTLTGQAATGGLPPYTYSWSPLAGVATPNQLTTSCAPDSSSTYYLTATDANGCTGVDSVIVKVNGWPILPQGANTSLTICAGDSITIGGTATGSGPFTYQWTPTAGLSGANIGTPIASPRANTTYTLVVTDSKGCQNHAVVTFFVNPSPQPHIITTDTILCAGDTTTLTSSDSGYKSFQWSTGETTKSIRVWKAGRYKVTAFAANGCGGSSPSDSITVLPAPPVPQVSLSGPIKFCDGGAVTLSVTLGNNSCKWSNGGVGPSINVTQSGSYTATITTANGCSSTSVPVVVTVYPQPKPVIAGPLATCPHSTETYTVNDSIKNKYVWTVSVGGIITAGAGTNSVTVQWATAGAETLSVTETNPTSNCSGSSSAIVVIGSTLKLQIGVKGDLVLCGGDSVTLDAGSGFTSYAWSNGATSQTITTNQAGSFFVNVKDASGCAGSSDTVVVSVGQNLSPIISGPDTVCANTTATYHTTASAGRTYQWQITGGTSANGNSADSIVVNWGNKGTGTLGVNESSGACSGSTTTSITISDSVTPTIIASGPTTFCTGDSVVLSAPAGMASYHWSSGDTTINITVHNSGTFSVQVFSAQGCSGTSSPVTVSVGSSLLPVITGATEFCPGGRTTLDAGVGYTTYLWSTGASTETIVVTTPGAFHVSVSRGSCSGTSMDVNVTQYPAPVATITVSGDTLISSIAATYQWNFNDTIIAGATLQKYIFTQAGKYTVSITDGNGCGVTSAPYFYSAVQPTVVVAAGAVPQVNPGGTMEIPIEIISQQNLNASAANHYAGILRYNGSMIFPKASRGGTLGASAAINGSTDRTVQFEGFSAARTTDTLQWIQCDALLGNDTCSTVTLDTFYWTDAPVTVTPIGGEFCESGICMSGGTARLINAGGQLTLAPGHPDPATDVITFEFDLIETGSTQLQVQNIMGRTIRAVLEENKGPGHYIVTVPLRDLTSGCYVCVLRTPSQVLRQLFLVGR